LSLADKSLPASTLVMPALFHIGDACARRGHPRLERSTGADGECGNDAEFHSFGGKRIDGERWPAFAMVARAATTAPIFSARD
jgi:hypothetical protein